jgi:hypothetical protein
MNNKISRVKIINNVSTLEKNKFGIFLRNNNGDYYAECIDIKNDNDFIINLAGLIRSGVMTLFSEKGFSEFTYKGKIYNCNRFDKIIEFLKSKL